MAKLNILTLEGDIFYYKIKIHKNSYCSNVWKCLKMLKIELYQ